MMKKKTVALFLAPLFVLTACSSDETPEKYVNSVPQDSNVSVNDEGFYTTADLAKLQDSYEQAKEKGYTGTLEEWIGLVKLSETNPQQAAQVAEDFGFSGGEMLLGALAGAAVGAIAGNALSSRSNMANDTYSAQRTNNTNNYAYSQPYKSSKDCPTGQSSRADGTCIRSSGSTSTTNTAATNAALVANRSGSNIVGSKTSTPTTTRSVTSTPAVKSAPAPTVRSTSVSRGGFGGSYGGGRGSGG